MINEALLSSKNTDWCTPQDFFDELNKEFHFTLDAAATRKSAKCEKYFTKETDALKSNWYAGGGTIFCNPPYGRQLKLWVKKAYEESIKNRNTIVLLIPARTDTSYFHDYIYRKAEVRFIKGRLTFTDEDGNPQVDAKGRPMPAPFPSMLVIYNGGKKMERLTIRNGDGSVSQPTDSTFEKVFNKLAEYEDTGMEPRDIRRMKDFPPDNFSIGLIFEQYMKRIKELQENGDTYYDEEKTLELFSSAMRVLFKRGFGDVFTVDNFIGAVSGGGFIDYDGRGYFATIDGTEEKEIRCDVEWLKNNRGDYPFVIWYNK